MPLYTFLGNVLLESYALVRTQIISSQLSGLESCYVRCRISLHIAEINIGIYDLQKVQLVHSACLHVCIIFMYLKSYYLI